MKRINYAALQDQAADNVSDYTPEQDAVSMAAFVHKYHYAAWLAWAEAQEYERLQVLANTAQDEARESEREWSGV